MGDALNDVLLLFRSSTSTSCSRLLICHKKSLLLLRLFLTGNRAPFSFAGTGIGFGTLAPHRQPAPMAQASIALYLHQSPDVQLNLTSKVALHPVFPLDDLTQAP